MLQQSKLPVINTAFIVWLLSNKFSKLLSILFKTNNCILLYTIYNMYKHKRFSSWKSTKNLTVRLNKKTPFLLLNFYIQKSTIFSYTKMRKSAFYKKIRYFYKIKKSRQFFKVIKQMRRRAGVKHFNFLKYLNFYKAISRYNYSKNTFSLQTRTFLNKKVIRKEISNYFYKKTKYKLFKSYSKKSKLTTTFNSLRSYAANKLFSKYSTNKLTLLNFHKKLYWKIRKSRIVHWDSFKRGTVNKSRYSKFISKFMRLKDQLSTNNMFVVLACHVSQLALSWRQVSLLLEYQLIVVNGVFYPNNSTLKCGDIIEFCYGRGLQLHKRIYNFFNKRIIYRLKRWSYRNKLVYEDKTRSKKFKKIPKSINSLGLSYRKYGKSFMYARSLGLLAVIYPIKKYIHEPSSMFYKTTIVKLNNWRYRF